MAWIESHDTIWEHHKTIRLCSMLGIGRAQAVGHLHALWHFVLRNAWKDADLELWGDAEIERGAWWDGEKGSLTKALRECGFLDGFIVHDWVDRAGRLVGDRIYNELRRKSSVKRTSKRRKSLATLPNPTLPNPTQPYPTMDIGRIIPPKLEWVKDFCLERKNKVDPDIFFSHYESNGWKVGKNPMKSWKAAICGTWEKNNGGFNGNGQKRIVGSGAEPVPGKYDHLG